MVASDHPQHAVETLPAARYPKADGQPSRITKHPGPETVFGFGVIVSAPAEEITGACIEHDGYCARDGTAIVKRLGRNWPAARWVWFEANGEIPKGKVVAHLCRNPSCVCLDHLKLMTRRELAILCGLAKLTHTEAEEIRESDLTHRELARRYGIVQGTVSAIRRGLRWGLETGA